MLNSAVSESLLNSMMNVTNSKSVKIEQNQLMNIECNPSPEVVKAHVNAYARCVENAWDLNKCNGVQYACVVENLSQTASLEYRGTSKLDSDTVQKVQSQMSADLTNKVKERNDDFGTALKQLMSTGSESDSSKNIQNNITQRVKQSVTANLLNEVNTAFQGNQTMNVKNTSGRVSNLTQNSAVRLVEDIVSRNSNVQDTINDLKVKVDNSTDVENKGLTNIVDSVMDFFKTSSLGFIAAFVIVMLIIGVVAYFTFTNDNVNVTARQAISRY